MRQPRPSRRRKTHAPSTTAVRVAEAAGKVGILFERGDEPVVARDGHQRLELVRARARMRSRSTIGDVDAMRAAGVAAEGAAQAVPEIAPGEDRVVHLVDDGRAVASGEGAREREERQAALGSAEPSAGSAGGAESVASHGARPRRRPRPRRLPPAATRGRDTRLDGRRAARHRLTARLEHGLERLDAVVGRLEEEVVHDRLRPLELLHERERHGSARHRRRRASRRCGCPPAGDSTVTAPCFPGWRKYGDLEAAERFFDGRRFFSFMRRAWSCAR